MVVNTQIQWGLPPSLQHLETQTVGLYILSLAEVGTTVSADHLLQMAAMPLEHKPTALIIPYAIPVSYQFEGAEELIHSLHALFGLLATADTPRYCPQATGFGRQLCTAAGTDSAHVLSIALSMVSALQSGRHVSNCRCFRGGKNQIACLFAGLVCSHFQPTVWSGP